MTDRTEVKSVSTKLNTFLSGKSSFILTISAVVVAAIIIAVVAYNIVDNRATTATEAAEALQARYDDWYSQFSTGDEVSEEVSTLEADLRSAAEELQSDFPRSYGALRASMILANLEWEVGNFEPSREAFLSVANSDSTGYLAASALFSAAACSEELDEIDKAMELYEEVVSLEANNPQIPRALFNLGRLSEEAGNPARAFIYYNRLIDEHGSSNWTNLGRSRIIWLNSRGGNSDS